MQFSSYEQSPCSQPAAISEWKRVFGISSLLQHKHNEPNSTFIDQNSFGGRNERTKQTLPETQAQRVNFVHLKSYFLFRARKASGAEDIVNAFLS